MAGTGRLFAHCQGIRSEWFHGGRPGRVSLSWAEGGPSAEPVWLSEGSTALDAVALLQARELIRGKTVSVWTLTASPLAPLWPKQGTFAVAKGGSVAGTKTDISCRWESRCAVSLAVPSEATLAVVPVLIAVRRQVPPEQLNLCDANGGRC
jgi:hypothetical protein